jgi:alanine dehydrogenase
MGAIEECYEQGAQEIRILGRTHTTAEKIIEHLQWADLVINGAEQPRELRGKNFLITRDQAREFLAPGSVVIDLVGGSASNRSPVENIIKCTFLTDPFFIEDEVYFSSLWGWPMMGFERESAIRYSSQITDILLGTEKLIRGLDHPSPGVEIAHVNRAKNINSSTGS